jgi:hypothetical protein
MTEELNDVVETTEATGQTEPSQRARANMQLIGLLFLLPLVLMFVTAVVCIVFVFARH